MTISGGIRFILVAIDELWQKMTNSGVKITNSGGKITNSGGRITNSGGAFNISVAPHKRFQLKNIIDVCC